MEAQKQACAKKGQPSLCDVTETSDKQTLITPPLASCWLRPLGLTLCFCPVESQDKEAANTGLKNVSDSTIEWDTSAPVRWLQKSTWNLVATRSYES